MLCFDLIFTGHDDLDYDLNLATAKLIEDCRGC